MIRFELWNWELGFYIEFQVKYSQHNLNAICALPGSRDIRIITTQTKWAM